MSVRDLVTGATGLLGSYIVEQLRSAGAAVRVLVRPGRNSSFLRDLGAEVVEGDLRDPASVRRSMVGVRHVFHAAAHVGDWGKWASFRDDNVLSTRNVIDACRAEGVERLLHVSAISVYGRIKATPGAAITEDYPLGQKYWAWDHYLRSKVLAEQIAWEFPATTVVRPCALIGARDRSITPRIVAGLRAGLVALIGRGDNPLNLLYAGDAAAGAILAARHPPARGQAYNLCSEGGITQRELSDALTDALAIPPTRRRLPYGLAFRIAFLLEAFARLLRRRSPPSFTRAGVYLLGRTTNYSIAKARTQLGWRPEVDAQEAVRRAMVWYCGLEENRHLGIDPACFDRLSHDLCATA